MKLRHVFFTIAFSLIISGIVWFYFFKNNYYCCIPVSFEKYDFPSIKVSIGNQTFPLELDIGSRFPMFLNKEILDKIDKKQFGVGQWREVDGNWHESPKYLVPEININSLSVKDITINEIKEDQFSRTGKLGKFLGGDFNLLLDFQHSRIIACDSISKLKRKGLLKDDWIKIPLEVGRAGIILKVKTDIGLLRLAINTAATKTGVRSSIVQNRDLMESDSKWQIYNSSLFQIGKIEFNNTDLYVYDIATELNEIDGFIGMDFLKSHSMYIDYINQFIYLEPHQEYFTCLPITFDNSKIPYIPVEIENQTYILEFDLGSYLFISLNSKILEKIKKKPYGESQWKDFFGNEYESFSYVIPKIKIGNHILSNIRATQDNENFHVNVNIKGNVPNKLGAVGRPFVEKYNLFLNFKKKVIYTCQTFSKLKNKGLISNNFIKVPFIQNKNGILLEVETEIGIKRFLLDTGASRTVLRSNIVSHEYVLNTNNSPVPIFITSKFIIGGKDFTEGEILLLEINPEYDFDGLLGMDFLEIFPIYIDFINRFIYIDLGEIN